MATQEENFSTRKKRAGLVVSRSPHKTIIVKIFRKVIHPLYRKFVTKTTKLMAHDEENECTVGDEVMLMETRPLSKRKCWRVVKVLRKKK